MKRILFSFLCIAAFSSLAAQTDKGWRSVGGSGQLQLHFKDKYYGFNLSPEIYWFVANNFALGTDFGAGFVSSKTNDTTSASSVFAFATLGARYYFSDTEHKWRPYLFANGGWELIAGHSKQGSASSNYDSNGFRGYAGGGLAWFFSEHAAFDTRVHLIDYSSKTARFDPSFTIGIQAFFHHD
jgi:hypothetical protein